MNTRTEKRKDNKSYIDTILAALPRGSTVKYVPSYNADRYILTDKPKMCDEEIDFVVYMMSPRYKWMRIEHGDGECTIVVQES